MEDEQQPRIDLKQAVKTAAKNVTELYEATGHRLEDLLLEEVERSDDVWLITMGFTRPTTSVGGAIAGLAGGSRRVYKRVEIDAETGEFLKMAIREPMPQGPQQPR